MAKEKKTTNGLSSDFIFHPGDTLKEILNDRNMSQYELSIRTNVSAKHISTIISGEKDISMSFAKKLEYALGIEASFWINLQAKYDQDMYEFQEANSISKEELEVLNQLKGDVLNDYINNGWINPNDSKVDLVLKFRKLLCISDLSKLKKITYASAFRIRDGINPYVLQAWQKMCELKNKDETCQGELDINRLKKRVESIKRTMFLKPDNMYIELKRILSECGIVFDIVHNYKGAPVQGYIKETNKHLLLCMTLRGRYIDIFWFTLFHELGHIINGDNKNIYIDFNHVDNEKEHNADRFARNVLIPDDVYNNFVIEGNYRDIRKIRKLSSDLHIDPSIIVGRLLKDELVEYAELGKYRKQYIWTE